MFFRYLQRLKYAIRRCPEALPSVKEISSIFDLELIVRYIIFGSTEKVVYQRFKELLLRNTVGGSVDGFGIVKFKSRLYF